MIRDPAHCHLAPMLNPTLPARLLLAVVVVVFVVVVAVDIVAADIVAVADILPTADVVPSAVAAAALAYRVDPR